MLKYSYKFKLEICH